MHCILSAYISTKPNNQHNTTVVLSHTGTIYIAPDLILINPSIIVHILSIDEANGLSAKKLRVRIHEYKLHYNQFIIAPA